MRPDYVDLVGVVSGQVARLDSGRGSWKSWTRRLDDAATVLDEMADRAQTERGELAGHPQWAGCWTPPTPAVRCG